MHSGRDLQQCHSGPLYPARDDPHVLRTDAGPGKGAAGGPHGRYRGRVGLHRSSRLDGRNARPVQRCRACSGNGARRRLRVRQKRLRADRAADDLRGLRLLRKRGPDLLRPARRRQPGGPAQRRVLSGLLRSAPRRPLSCGKRMERAGGRPCLSMRSFLL